jgi:hypothetical protein
MRERHTSAAAIVCIGLVALAGAATADEDVSDEAVRARALSTRGLEEFKSGRFAEAIVAFEASYAIVPAPALIYDSAQAHRLLGHCQEALAGYRRYLSEAPAAKNRAAVEARIAEMRQCASAGDAPSPAPSPPPAPVAAKPVLAPAPVAAAPLAVTATPSERRAPIYKRWWLWTGVGALVAGGVVGGVLAATLRPTFHTTLPDSGPAAALPAALTVRF